MMNTVAVATVITRSLPMVHQLRLKAIEELRPVKTSMALILALSMQRLRRRYARFYLFLYKQV
jgi:hypothetical protein